MKNLLDFEHKIGLGLFLLFAVFGIPLTIVAVKHQNDVRSRASTASLQIGSFSPESFADKTKVSHVPGELIVRFKDSVNINTISGTSKNSFKPGDITSGLPTEEVNAMTQSGITSIDKLFQGEDTTSSTGKKYISNVYKLTVPTSADLASIMSAVCPSDSVMYCEPNYTFAPAMKLNSPVQKAYAAPNTTNQAPSALVGFVDVPLPANYSQMAGALGLPAIGSSQIVSESIAPRNDGFAYHALFAAAAAYSVNSNVKYIFVGVCGDTCSSADLAKGILDAQANGAKVIYLGQASPFPENVEPMTVVTAADYVTVKGSAIVAPIGNSQNSGGGTAFVPQRSNVLGLSTKNSKLLAEAPAIHPNLTANGKFEYKVDGGYTDCTGASSCTGLDGKTVNPLTSGYANNLFDCGATVCYNVGTGAELGLDGKATGKGSSEYYSPTKCTNGCKDGLGNTIIQTPSGSTNPNSPTNGKATVSQPATSVPGAAKVGSTDATQNAPGKVDISSPSSLQSYLGSCQGCNTSLMNSLVNSAYNSGNINQPAGSGSTTTPTGGTSIATGNAAAAMAMVYAGLPSAEQAKLSSSDVAGIINSSRVTSGPNLGQYDIQAAINSAIAKADSVSTPPPPAPPQDPPQAASQPAAAPQAPAGKPNIPGSAPVYPDQNGSGLDYGGTKITYKDTNNSGTNADTGIKGPEGPLPQEDCCYMFGGLHNVQSKIGDLVSSIHNPLGFLSSPGYYVSGNSGDSSSGTPNGSSGQQSLNSSFSQRSDAESGLPSIDSSISQSPSYAQPISTYVPAAASAVNAETGDTTTGPDGSNPSGLSYPGTATYTSTTDTSNPVANAVLAVGSAVTNAVGLTGTPDSSGLLPGGVNGVADGTADANATANSFIIGGNADGF